MAAVDTYKRNRLVEQTSKDAKKCLVMRFLTGDKKVIKLMPENLPIIFGAGDKNPESGQRYTFIELSGEKIAPHHFEIDFDQVLGALKLRNLCLDPEVSCGLYKMLLGHESFNLVPGDAFRIGSIEFEIERFNTGIVSDIGQRDYMEDYNRYVQ